jgi:benzoyl-CoA oxygenase/reductase BoxA protein
LEGQNIGILPPGLDANGKPHYVRMYSIASPRDGERPGYNNISLTIKRVTEDHEGKATPGVGSNYMCDLKPGDKVQVIGPYGTTFLMPNHPGSSLMMICTGTGSAPMRAMTEFRRRHKDVHQGGKLMLFFGARAQDELPYFGPLMKLPKDFIDINFAFSRTPNQPKLDSRPSRRRGDTIAGRKLFYLYLRPERYGRRRESSVQGYLCRPRHGLEYATARTRRQGAVSHRDLLKRSTASSDFALAK